MCYGMRLQSLREQSGLTRAEVSSRTGISRSTLAKIEAGMNIPTIEQFIRLANSLRVRLPKLLMDVGVIRNAGHGGNVEGTFGAKCGAPSTQKWRTGARVANLA